jgi:hypothetical protein
MALQTITSLTATQNPNDLTYKVNFGFNIADADSDTLDLAYSYKKQVDSTWLPATTTGPVSIAAVAGNTALTGAWDLDKDYFGNESAVPLTLRVTSTKAAIAATGTLTAIAASTSAGIEDGDSFVVGGRTYEFSLDTTVTNGRVRVVLATATDTDAVVKAAIIAAINTDTLAGVVAVSRPGMLIGLAAKTPGVDGNDAITESISNSATLTPVGLTGGVDAEIVSATVNVTANTGTGVAPSSVVDTAVDTRSIDYSKHVIEGRGNEYGAVAQGELRGSFANKVLNTVSTGVRDFARIYGDRNIRNERAVLVNPDFYTVNKGSLGFVVAYKPISWFTDVAYRGLSNDKMWENDTVYAIVRQSVVRNTSTGVLMQQGVVLAYLMSAAQFTETVN